MSEHTEKDRGEANQDLERQTMRFVRRLGYVVFFGATVLLSVPMIFSAISGIRNDRIWDPMTGEPVSRAHMELSCLDEAQQLVFNAGQQGQWTGSMEQRYRLWLARCQSDYPQAYDMLLTTRTRLRVASGEGDGH
jgi:hypothetical protein